MPQDQPTALTPVLSLLLRRKGLRNPDRTLQALDRGSRRGGRVAVAGRTNPEPPRFSQVWGVARPVLAGIDVELRETCSRARWDKGRTGVIVRSLGYPRLRCRRLP